MLKGDLDKRYIFIKKLTFTLLFFILFIFGLIQSRDFLVPLLLGVLFAYLLYPIVGFLEKHKFPRILSILIGIFTAIGVIILAVNFFSNQITVFADNLPEIREQAEINLERMRDNISSTLGVTPRRFRGWEDDITSGMFEISEEFGTIFTATTNTVVNILLMPVFIFCLLYYRNKFYDFIIQMVPKGAEKKAEHMLEEINLVTQKYMTGVFIVVIILSIVHSVVFSIIGLDYPIFFGVTAALFNFIPYFGTLIGAILPVLYALLAMQGTDYVLWILIYFLIIQFVENNILTPNITGGYVHLNPFVTILTLIFGSMIWGVAGMFIIMPFMAMIKIACQHISFMKPVGYLLSDKGTEKYSISWENIKSVFTKKK
jgi:predicted PurR-regulated permease PerM